MTNILCVAGKNSVYKLAHSQPAGFFAGLWHGMILPITFIISIFNPNVGIYETNNTGALYNFGFILGVSASFGGGASQASR